jgi:hypothetical protein
MRNIPALSLVDVLTLLVTLPGTMLAAEFITKWRTADLTEGAPPKRPARNDT